MVKTKNKNQKRKKKLPKVAITSSKSSITRYYKPLKETINITSSNNNTKTAKKEVSSFEKNRKRRLNELKKKVKKKLIEIKEENDRKGNMYVDQDYDRYESARPKYPIIPMEPDNIRNTLYPHVSGYRNCARSEERDRLSSDPFEYYDTHWDFLVEKCISIKEDWNYWEIEYNEYRQKGNNYDDEDEMYIVCTKEFKEEYEEKKKERKSQLF